MTILLGNLMVHTGVTWVLSWRSSLLGFRGGVESSEIGTEILSFDKKKEGFPDNLWRRAGSLGQQYFYGHKLLLMKKRIRVH